jgi:hypothetical protein
VAANTNSSLAAPLSAAAPTPAASKGPASPVAAGPATGPAPRRTVGPAQRWAAATVGVTVGAVLASALLAPRSSSPGAALVLLVFLGSSVHVAATAWLATFGELRRQARDHPTRFLYVPPAMIVGTAGLAGLLSPHQLSRLLVAYFAWQVWHYQRQNLGFAALAASSDPRLVVASGKRRPDAGPAGQSAPNPNAYALWHAGRAQARKRLPNHRPKCTNCPDPADRCIAPAAAPRRQAGGGAITRLQRRAVTASGLAAALEIVARPSVLQLGVGDPAGWLWPFALALFTASAGLGLATLIRRPAGTGAAMLAMTFLFPLPLFIFTNPYASIGGLTIAHGLQYLLFVGTITAGHAGPARRTVRVASMATVALLLGLALATASHLHGGTVPLRMIFGAYLGLVMTHFVVDAGAWRLRDPHPRQLIATALPWSSQHP